jgi:hypothetical protein
MAEILLQGTGGDAFVGQTKATRMASETGHHVCDREQECVALHGLSAASSQSRTCVAVILSYPTMRTAWRTDEASMCPIPCASYPRARGCHGGQQAVHSQM